MEKGIDLTGKLADIELDGTYVDWVLTRPVSKNTMVSLDGLLIGGCLSNNIIGRALATHRNVVLISDFNKRGFAFEPLAEIPEICFKHDLYILSWKMTWLNQTHSGNRVLGQIFQAANHYNLQVNNETHLPLFQYEKKKTITTILHRINEYYEYRQMKTKIKKITVVLYWSDIKFNTLMGLEHKNEILVLTTQLDPRYTTTLLQTGYSVVWIDPISLLDEVSRELYYIIKRKNSLDIDYIIQT